MAKRRKKTKKEILSNFLGMAAMAAVVLILLAVLSLRMISLKKTEEEYAAQEESLQAEYDDLEKEQEKLEQQRIYVQTEQYIRDMAKSRLGLVDPDEIILTPEE